MTVIALSGEPGCGSTTTGKLLAKALGLDFFSVGAYTKEVALRTHREPKETRRASEFWRSKKGSSKKFHKSSDAMQKSLARKGNIVIDGKLSVHMLKNIADAKIWLKAPLSVRAKRVANRDKIPLTDARKIVDEKENLERTNWKRIYGFDYFRQEREADIVINVGSKTPEQIVNLVISRIKRVFIVHGWEGRPNKDWYPYVKKELEKKGYVVDVLSMPSPDLPKLKQWVPYLAKSIGEPNENTFLIGHSAGVITILKYFEHLPHGKKTGGCVLVAGWTNSLGYKELENFCKKPLNWQRIRQHCKRFVIIHSDNDPYVPMTHGMIFKKHLKGRLIIEHNKGHMTDEEGVKKLPSVVKSIENF